MLNCSPDVNADSPKRLGDAGGSALSRVPSKAINGRAKGLGFAL